MKFRGDGTDISDVNHFAPFLLAPTFVKTEIRLSKKFFFFGYHDVCTQTRIVKYNRAPLPKPFVSYLSLCFGSFEIPHSKVWYSWKKRIETEKSLVNFDSEPLLLLLRVYDGNTFTFCFALIFLVRNNRTKTENNPAIHIERQKTSNNETWQITLLKTPGGKLILANCQPNPKLKIKERKISGENEKKKCHCCFLWVVVAPSPKTYTTVFTGIRVDWVSKCQRQSRLRRYGIHYSCPRLRCSLK